MFLYPLLLLTQARHMKFLALRILGKSEYFPWHQRLHSMHITEFTPTFFPQTPQGYIPVRIGSVVFLDSKIFVLLIFSFIPLFPNAVSKP